MAKLILVIEDTKLEFFKNIIQNFSFVKIEEDEYEEDTDEQVMKNIFTGVKELKEDISEEELNKLLGGIEE